MFGFPRALISFALLFTLPGVFADVPSPPPKAHLLSDWGGIRTAAEKRGLNLDAHYFNDLQGNPVGGLDRRFANAGAFYASADADLYRLLGTWQGLSLFTSASWWTGQDLSRFIGNVFNVSAWYAGTTFYLDELYLKQQLPWRRAKIKLGRLMAGPDFATSALFYNYVTLAINANPASLLFNTLFPIDPYAQWGAYFQFDPLRAITLKVGIYNGNPDVLENRYHGLNWSFRHPNGILVIGQLDARHLIGHLRGQYRIGSYYVTSTPTRNYGFYLVFEQQFFQKRHRTLSGWAVGLVTNDDGEQIPYFGALGLVAEGFIPCRPNDSTNLGFAYGRFRADQQTPEILRISDRFGNLPQSYEAVLELNHWIQILPGFALTPLAQWVINPGATDQTPDALVLGLQISAIL
jgi:porin